jgi:hypothetical protein
MRNARRPTVVTFAKRANKYKYKYLVGFSNLACSGAFSSSQAFVVRIGGKGTELLSDLRFFLVVAALSFIALPYQTSD